MYAHNGLYLFQSKDEIIASRISLFIVDVLPPLLLSTEKHQM